MIDNNSIHRLFFTLIEFDYSISSIELTNL